MSFSELAFHHRLARPGTIIDVGANIGGFSLHFSVWEQMKLWAFEPFPPTFERLKAALIEGHHGVLPPRVTLKMAALGSTQGTAKLRIPRSSHGVVDQWASLAKSFEGMDGVSYDEIDVPLWTVDGFGFDDVTAMKVDAEGFEQEVLQGSIRTLRDCRPIVSCELEERHREGCTWYVPGFMRGLGYDCLYYNSGEFWSVEHLDRPTMQVASKNLNVESYSSPYIHEFYFVPRERQDLREALHEFGKISL